MKKEDSELGESLIDITENGHAKMVIDRPIFNQQKLDEGFEAGVRPQSSLKSSCRKACSKCACSKTCCKNFLLGIFPFLSILKGYNVKSDLPSDIISGLTVGIMHIPQGKPNTNLMRVEKPCKFKFCQQCCEILNRNVNKSRCVVYVKETSTQ